MSTYKFESSSEYQNLSKAQCEPIDDHFRQSFQKHFYGNVFFHETHPNGSRVFIGVDESQISLMLDIAKRWQGPYGILYVLKVPRHGHAEGRYQVPVPCTFDALEYFADKFQKYFEVDGRHNLWFKDLASNNQLIYDNHNIIYSYGEDEEIIDLLKIKGFKEGKIKVPVPHSHSYNEEYDNSEDEIIDYFQWKIFPLQDIDNKIPLD
jgi:hypothetical protein